ncbi:MAG: methylenetetrahydrofolate--tRNA-(uracil(54)-C(5))-methyltransferase (FADH(2)-oxidizing) TrmFO [Nitrospirae bacterium]|nr:methylenetetrahydrofolate--tRNA-(uracil(54)-C(5))-methyltransferase (FADH(2)-oxidizing) TrmFO [Nitrospirota bacterium]
MEALTIIGGGLSGCEAAWQAARRGIRVRIYEMRPLRTTGAHKTGLLGELVCSNSLRSKEPTSAAGLLKEELKMAGSLIMEAAERCSVPAGSALAVDRGLFAEYITEKLSAHPSIEVIREEVVDIPEGPCIVATGPLTSDALSAALKKLLGGDYLYFYDAIAPIVDAESIDYSRVFRASRYGKGEADYLNCPMSRDEYDRFYSALLEADRVTPKEFEDERVFEGCMPVEVMARRGRDTLRFGPMKPVGLIDPRTGHMPYAVVQLRIENMNATAYNMVGFQTRLKWPEQKRVFRLIPGLENAVFMRYGSIHRNTFINGPMFLAPDLSLKVSPDTYIAGQLSGVEGYIESTAMGTLAGINAARRLKGLGFTAPPAESAHGALIHYITTSPPAGFQPSNINFGLFPPPGVRIKDKKERRAYIVEKALTSWKEYLRKADE